MLVTVEVIREGAINLLSEMERLDLIKVNPPIKDDVMHEKTLSLHFAGALHLSDIDYESYQNALREGRSEWRKDIC